MNVIRVLSVVGSLGLTYGLGSFESLHWLWQLPVFFLCFWIAQILLFLGVLYLWCARIDLDTPSVENSRDRKVLNLCADFALSFLHLKVHATGMEKLPTEGRFLLVCNHLSLLDPVVLIAQAKKSQLAFISKQENKTMPFVNRLMHQTQCQLLNRENDREALKTILNCIALIKEDKASIAVFPEGYTSRTGHLQPFRNGVFKIAQRSKVPIVVCTVQNTNLGFRNFLHGRRTHVKLDLLEVIQPEELAGTTKEIGDHVHSIMAHNLGEPEVDNGPQGVVE